VCAHRFAIKDAQGGAAGAGGEKSGDGGEGAEEDALLYLSAKFMNAEAELCRLFGAKTVPLPSTPTRHHAMPCAAARA
jgi:hypothetical protein